ncbi:hypothetical protein [Aquimarina macrocephali]|uniref:hypothetical protein n=1 Tax=Aquimarina macrocephali TaxID=666563 RepID=UPI003F68052F
MIKRYIIVSLIFTFSTVISQETIVKPEFAKYPIDAITKEKISNTLESLFSEIGQGNINPDFLTTKKRRLTMVTLHKLMNYELKKDTLTPKVKDKQLINMYPISNHEYVLSISYTLQKDSSLPTIVYVVNLVATERNKKITFSIPLEYQTKYWHTEEIGNITYHYRGKINKERAQLFDKKNTQIANNLGLTPEKIDFYMCDNFQEILNLRGIVYSVKEKGKYRDGYGVVDKTIFSVMNNEDFSHDMLHYYSGKINERKNRNWITEEGVAYSWGNAYYTDKNGEMITHNRLVDELKEYLSKNTNTNLFELFSENVKIFDHIAPEVSVRSTISGLIVNLVQKEQGIEGVLKLIKAGRQNKLENFLKKTNELIGLNQNNFNLIIEKLITEN